MKNKMRWLSAILCLLHLGTTHALTLNPQKVVPGVYAFIGDTGMRTLENEGMNANTGFIVTDAGVVVIDSGSTWQVAQEIHRAIQTVTRQKVKVVVNTGGQDHRWLGNGYFKSIGAQIIAARPAQADMKARGRMHLEALQKVLGDKTEGTQPVYPDRYFDQSVMLTMGGHEIRLLYFHGGHTPGDSVVWLPKQKVLFSGDLVYVDRLLGVLPFSKTGDWLVSFAEMERLEPETIIPGHGKVCDLVQARRDTADYLRLLTTYMQQAVENGIELQVAMDSLDQSAFKRLRNYDLLRGINASRTYLEMESR